MQTFSEISLFNALKNKFGEKEAELLVGYVKSSVKEEVATQVPYIATKDFVESKISEATAKTDSKIAEAKFQIILWSFVFWVTQLGAVFTFIKFVK